MVWVVGCTVMGGWGAEESVMGGAKLTDFKDVPHLGQVGMGEGTRGVTSRAGVITFVRAAVPTWGPCLLQQS